MSDSEDDYMFDKLLSNCQDDIRPGLVFSAREKRKLEMYKKQQEVMCKKPKTVSEQEAESRERGLSTAIPSENKGFKLLEKMGFKPGDSLGKSKTGLKEPINIVLKQGTSGVGKEKHDRETVARKIAQKQRYMRDFENQFRVTNVEKRFKKMLRKDFLKAQSVCEELDFRKNISDPVEDFYWTRDTVRKRRMEEKGGCTDEYESDDDTEFEEQITEENLAAIIDYLREEHVYCLYCVITGANQEDLQENCPGPYRTDHDLDLE